MVTNSNYDSEWHYYNLDLSCVGNKDSFNYHVYNRNIYYTRCVQHDRHDANYYSNQYLQVAHNLTDRTNWHQWHLTVRHA